MIEHILILGNSQVVQWLILCTFGAGDMGLIPGQGIKIPHAKILYIYIVLAELNCIYIYIYIYGLFFYFLCLFLNFSINNLYHLHNNNAVL